MMNISDQVGERKFLIGFSKLFPDETPLTLAQYLGDFSRKDVLLASTFLAGLRIRGSEYEDYRELLNRWFNSANTRFCHTLISRLIAFEAENDIPVVIINPMASLRIFEFAFNHLDDQKTTNDTQLEVNLIKAYLVVNESITNLEYVSSKSVNDIDIKIKWSCFVFCSKFSSYEFLHYYLGEVSITQIIKSIYFFDFLSSRGDTEWLLKEFLSVYGHKNWKSYLKAYLPLTHSVIKKSKEGYMEFIVPKDDNYEIHCNFLDNFIIQDEQTLDEFDFISTSGASIE